MTSCFITAIGTGVGKTLVTAALAHQLAARGYHPHPLKPVMSGLDTPEPSDAAIIYAASGNLAPYDLGAVSPWRFQAPLAPYMAAIAEKREIDPDELIVWCEQQVAAHPHTLIEGVGGIMVPLAADFWVIDWMIALDLPVILVASSYLGAINHSLLSIDTLRRNDVKLRGVVVSQSAPECDAGLEDTANYIHDYLEKAVPVISVARIETEKTPWKAVPDLLSLIV